ESLNISLSDIEGIEDVIYEQYLKEELGDDFEIVHTDDIEKDDEIELLLSGSHESIDLDILSKVGALEVAFNPLKKSVYAEVDFMALALAKEHKEKTKSQDSDTNKWVLWATLGAIAILALTEPENSARSDCHPVDTLNLKHLLTGNQYQRTASEDKSLNDQETGIPLQKIECNEGK
ncbi:MAG: hypothetical protein OXC40_05875, partial [Proteobacteria bacterium]|nr:hypothetical protein [Pseudomonadota bacterium]